MLSKLTVLLKQEQEMLSSLVQLAELQQEALINFKLDEIETLAKQQDFLANNLKKYEDNRIKLLMNWFGISRIDATNLRLSLIEQKVSGEDMKTIKRLRIAMKRLNDRLIEVNNINRTLSNRARNSVRNMMEMISNSPMRLCNVKV